MRLWRVCAGASFVLAACSTDSSPVGSVRVRPQLVPTPVTRPSPPGPGFSGQYQLTIDASAACASTGWGSLPARHFSWLVTATASSQSSATFTLPPLPDPHNLDDLILRLTANGKTVSGSLEGGARVDRSARAGYAVGFYDAPDADHAPTGAASLAGSLRLDDNGRVALVEGALAGVINVGLYASSDGGVCKATDHNFA